MITQTYNRANLQPSEQKRVVTAKRMRTNATHTQHWFVLFRTSSWACIILWTLLELILRGCWLA